MFELGLIKRGLIKKLLNLVGGMADGITVDCSSTALSVQAQDWLYTGTYLVLHLRSNLFDHFLCDQNISLGIQFSNLCPILARATHSDPVTIKGDNGSDTISIRVERTIYRGSEAVTYDIKLFENERLNIHEGAYEVIVQMPSQYFTNLCLTLRSSKYSETAKISVANNRVMLSNEVEMNNGFLHTDWREYIRNLDVPEDIAIINTNLTDPFSITFGLQRVYLIMHASYISNTVLIKMSSGLPVMLEYMIERTGYIRVYLS